MTKLIPQDIVERRVKCDICGYELTLVEFLISGCYCVFHEKDENKLKQLKALSKKAHSLLVEGDLALMKGKLAMKKRKLDHVDYMACVGEVVDEIQHASSKDIKRILKHMRAHGR